MYKTYTWSHKKDNLFLSVTSSKSIHFNAVFAVRIIHKGLLVLYEFHDFTLNLTLLILLQYLVIVERPKMCVNTNSANNVNYTKQQLIKCVK